LRYAPPPLRALGALGLVAQKLRSVLLDLRTEYRLSYTLTIPLFPTDQFLSPLFTIKPASIPSSYFFPRFYHRITFLSAEPLRIIFRE
jgi:hypothetical protein